MEIINLPILSKKQIAEGTFEVRLDLSKNKFPFELGQYIRIIIPNLSENDPKGNYRDFSIASAPSEDKELAIAFRASGSGFKKSLLGLPNGANIKVSGPFGDFLSFIERQDVPFFFIAGGIGITAFLSTIRHLTSQKSHTKILLLYGNKDIASSAYLDELNSLAKQNEFLKLVNIIGNIDRESVEKIKTGVADPAFFIAGPPAMIESVSGILTDLNIPPHNVHVEEYLGLEAGKSKLGKIIEEFVKKEISDISVTETDLGSLLGALEPAALVSKSDATGTIIYANNKFVEISKYSREELIGQNHRILKSGEHSKEFYKDLWDTILQGKIWHKQIKNRAKDGSFYWVDGSIAPIMGADGKLSGFISVRFPITDQKNLEKLLKNENQLYFQQIIETIPEAFFITDGSQQKMEFISIGYEKIWHRTRKSLYENPKSWAENIHEEDRQKIIDENYGKEHTVPYYLNYRIVRPDKSIRWIHVKIFPILGPDGKPVRFVGIAEDRTEIKETVEKTEHLERELEIEKTKQEFVSIASHQLRTPLTAIRGYSEMLLEGDAGKLNKKQKDFLSEIFQANKRMLDLISALLNASRIDLGIFSIEPIPADILKIAKLHLKDFKQRLEKKRLKLKEKFDKNIGLLNLDPKLIGIIFQNLLSNAIKYTPSKGTIKFEIYKCDTGVCIEISDTGIGIPKAQQDKMFSKLFRADNAVSADPDGTGLGLYIVKSIVETSGGKIRFESEENKGTAFYIDLPLSGMIKREGNKGLT